MARLKTHHKMTRTRDMWDNLKKSRNNNSSLQRIDSMCGVILSTLTFSQLPGEVATFELVELGSELLSAVVKAGIHKHFIGEENFLVELAGGRDPNLKLGLQLRHAAKFPPSWGSSPSVVSWAVTVPVP